MLTNTLFKVKGVPLLYMPIFYYPVQKDDRATGFLIPIVRGLDDPRAVVEQRVLLGDQPQPGPDAASMTGSRRPVRATAPSTGTSAAAGSEGFVRFYGLWEHEAEYDDTVNARAPEL